jgi:hypothetical protein
MRASVMSPKLTIALLASIIAVLAALVLYTFVLV